MAFAALVRQLAAPPKEKKKTRNPQGKNVDTGSFGVFMNGRQNRHRKIFHPAESTRQRRHFGIQDRRGRDPGRPVLGIATRASGDLRKYEWKEISPGKAQAVIVPNDNLLVERSTTNPQDKQEEHPFLLPTSTSVLDDYFFIHREILVWKYLATGCRQDKGQVACPQNQQVKFGAINPHQRSSLLVSMAFTGKEKIPVHGVERELNHFRAEERSRGLVAVARRSVQAGANSGASDNTEVVRD